jgi:hypothetical protein
LAATDVADHRLEIGRSGLAMRGLVRVLAEQLPVLAPALLGGFGVDRVLARLRGAGGDLDRCRAARVLAGGITQDRGLGDGVDALVDLGESPTRTGEAEG